MKKCEVIAHRGASSQAPENTLAAVELALEHGADRIELDVRFTADHEVAVIHDSSLKRTTGRRGRVAEFSLSQLQGLDAGSWFDPRFRDQRIPSLEEVCRIVRDSDVGLLIEIKAESGVPEGFAEILIQKLSRQGMLSRSILQSFDHRLLVELRRRDPAIGLAALFDKRSADPVGEASRAGAAAVAVRRNLASGRLAARARERGIAVFVWTVDSERQMKKLFSLGIDGLITNRPARAIRVRDSLPPD